jgi:hypothetical protein
MKSNDVNRTARKELMIAYDLDAEDLIDVYKIQNTFNKITKKDEFTQNVGTPFHTYTFSKER